MIVWRVRGKIIRPVLCSIVCNSCAQCNAYANELVRFNFSVVILCYSLSVLDLAFYGHPME